MSYATALLRGWGRREWLTVGIIAVTTAFLIGSVTLLITASAYTETLQGDLGSTATITHVNSYAEAKQSAPSSTIVLRFIQISDGNRTVQIIGVPSGAPNELETASVAWEPATIPEPPSSGLRGPVDQPTVKQFDNKSVAVDPGDNNGMFPQSWYVGSVRTVSSFNQTAGLVINPQTGSYLTGDGAVPLIGTLPFLLGGVAEVVQLLSIVAIGGSVLILIVVYSVTRMAIKDRSKTIRVVRETGGAPGRLLVILMTRAGSLTGIGVFCGVIIGLGITRGVVAIAGHAGVPVSLQVTFTPTLLMRIIQLSGVLLIAGIVAGLIAGWSVIRVDPAQIGDDSKRDTIRLFKYLYTVYAELKFIRWRTAIPTIMTLSVFILVIFLTMATATAVAPLVTTSTGTIVESGAAHPLNSRVDVSYAETLRAQGISASPEVLYAQRYDGHSYLARGANFTAFQRVSDVRVVDGHPPTTSNEAIVGQSLSNTLNVSVGESLLVTGSVSPGVHQIKIVGAFQGSGITDDQLIIPIDTAQELATRENTVHIVRTAGNADRRRSDTTTERGIVVSEVQAPARVQSGESFDIHIKLRNLASTQRRDSLGVIVGEKKRSTQLRLAGQAMTQKTVSISLQTPGRYTIAVGAVRRSLRVIEPASLALPDELPQRAPPSATLLVPSVTSDQTIVENATITVGNRTTRTGSRGVGIIGVPSAPGKYTVSVSKRGYKSVNSSLVVDSAVEQRPRAQLSVNPSRGTPYTQPEITIRVANPWGEFIVQNITLTAPGTVRNRVIRLPSGNITQLTVNGTDIGLTGEVNPGRYPIKLYADGDLIARTTYSVEGSTKSNSNSGQPQGEYASGTAIGQAIENVFGNIQVLFLTLIVLAGLSTIGGTTAAFAQAVQTRKQEIGIYRATGATRRQVLCLLAGDAFLIAIPAGIVSCVGVYTVFVILSKMNLLVIFGVQLSVPLTPFVILSVLIAGVLLSVMSAVVAGLAFLSKDAICLLGT